MQQEFYCSKSTGTLADTLFAMGVATILDLVVSHATGGRRRVAIRDEGSVYVIDAGVPVQDEWLTYDPAIIPFVTDAKHPLPEDMAEQEARDVNHTWERVRTYFNQAKALHAERQKNEEWKTQAEANRKNRGVLLSQLAGGETEQQQEGASLPAEWTVTTYVGDYRMQAQDNYNLLIEQWVRANRAHPGLALRLLLRLAASPQINQDAVIEEWKKQTKGGNLGDVMVTASQLLNPHMGKGQNRSKANGLVMGNEKSFWLIEFAKAVGLWAAALPAKAPDSDLRKSYVLAPRRLDMRFHQKVFAKFRLSAPSNETSIKQDVIAVLRYTITLLEHLVEENGELGAFGGRVSDLVQGLAVATYQLLSRNSYTTMNLAFLGLPDWMPAIETHAGAQLLIAILREHLEHITAINEEESEGRHLLAAYRDFAAGNRMEAFFDFCTGYSAYLLRSIERKRWYIRPFLTTHMEALLIMNDKKHKPILENEGFRHIAAAIRRSTVSLVYQEPSKRRYDIRYGLGQELQRKARYDDEFLRALADFVQGYNDETLRVHERTKGKDPTVRRPLVTTHDLEDLVALVDEYGAATVCNLLIAYGYAREPREAEGGAQPGAQAGEGAGSTANSETTAP